MVESLFLGFSALVFSSGLAADEAPYPIEEVLAEFVDGCGTIDDQQSTAENLKEKGWRELSKDDEVGALGEFLAFSRKAAAEALPEVDAQASEMDTFQKEIAGETVFIILDEVTAEDIRISGCQLYDFGEQRIVTTDTLSERIGREPVEAVMRPELTRAEWQPGFLPEHDSFKLFFVPSGSPVSKVMHFSGLALMSDTVGVSE